MEQLVRERHVRQLLREQGSQRCEVELRKKPVELSHTEQTVKEEQSRQFVRAQG